MEQILWEFLVQREFDHDSHQRSLWIWLWLTGQQIVVPCAIHVDLGAVCCPLHRAHEHTHACSSDPCLVCITLTRPSADTGMITTSNKPPRNTMIAPESTTDHIFPMELFTIDDCVLTTRSCTRSEALSCWQPHAFQIDLHVWLRAQFFNSCFILIFMCCAVVIKSVALPLTWTLSWTAVKCRSTLRSRKATFRVPPTLKQN